MIRHRGLAVLLYGFALISAIAWLLIGAGPALADLIPEIHDRLHVLGEGDGFVAELADGIANTAHATRSGSQVAFDYLFSAVSLTAGAVVLRLRRNERAARLLALGMIGTAVAFNLQGHDALSAIPARLLGPVSTWHDTVHLVAGIAYVWALLLFPTGNLPYAKSRPIPLHSVAFVMVATFVVFVVAGTSIDEHTVGLVVLFGLVTPVVGIGSQVFRARAAPNADQRRQSWVVVKILLLAVGVAVPLIVWSAPPTGAGPPSETRRYEFTTPPEGKYFFVCDPHPEDMTGELIVRRSAAEAPAGAPIEIASVKSRFDTRRIVVPADTRVTIDFTNFDPDLHNVAVYTDSTRRDPIFIGGEFSGHTTAQLAFRTFRTLFAAIPIALFAVLVRFRLWDIDKLVSRTLVYGALAVLIAGVYVVAVTLVGRVVGGANTLLHVVATGIIALLVQPLRARTEALADRLVYGRRASPYGVMAEFTRAMADLVSVEEVLPRMAEAAARGSGARWASVRVLLPTGGERTETWPPGAPGEERARTIPIVYRGEEVGELAWSGGRDPHGLLHDLASQAGLALHNVQLTWELRHHVRQISLQAQELRASRRRIVSARDAERRRLERDIHDGAQQQLVALRVRLRLAESMLASSPDKAGPAIDPLIALARDALDTLRALAGGVFPPVLEDRGLAPALDAEAARIGGDMVADDEVRARRFDARIEQAVYFACLEALQNATKHAAATRIRISLALDGDALEFAVEDDGSGFETGSGAGTGMHNMRDRISAVGGTIEIISAPGAGTIVRGRIPVQERAAAHPSTRASGPNSDFGR
jgi:signal transduction histidine kinase